MTTASTLWFTGLSGAGKSTLATATAKALRARGHACTVLDGDIMRQGLCQGLGFSPADRRENLRRIAEVAALMNQAGLTVLVATISPLHSDREMARHIIGAAHWVSVYVSTALSVCEQRDAKGLYLRARRGEISDFTGVSAPYEVPSQEQLQIDTAQLTTEQAVHNVLSTLHSHMSNSSKQEKNRL
ncbi:MULTISPECIES: adenylyl-sulfate kinase [unclassified Undibacterium]|uniref:adenylyl-sulfate kinase n=1 Tax=unclassified Undibacterium TaxID=2630295 RepID=UPI002AC9AED7|nr:MULTISPECIES: adenylyl-sulfate kinase [unclassified Undibacterium]MEB0141192.1 adenylyl-sulfate kinase [Undibacterium sp. CCC2.1]MEB0174244.1 adenylyl-sulfate kinase [Undibacterium sp. CCC1.1]MEB0178191.1 adenylyl-sulfate kinase [Undibacterium sp. CCC3.4]MEB0217397.1 adenylyl-sulfate kinase [Undibacterium sp. 5I2]WPX42133.1 adenylyl-sulfate kinase [Undibacterium sp. CCC3.4]